MRGLMTLYRSSVGKKVTMAATGAVLFAYVVGHLAGNLKIYQGPEKYDDYARFLREVGAPVFGHGELLWIARVILLASVVLHIVAATQLARMSLLARDVGYRKYRQLNFSYASRTMRWGGVIIAAFVVYHLLHLTWGTAHPQFSHESVYHNVVTGFEAWPVSLAYVVAMIPLALHMYHGLWSGLQTMAINNPRIKGWRRPFAAAVALGVLVGNISIPVAVLAGWVR